MQNKKLGTFFCFTCIAKVRTLKLLLYLMSYLASKLPHLAWSEGDMGHGAATFDELNKVGVMRWARGHNATTRQDKTRQWDDEMTHCDDETWWCNATQHDVAMQWNDATEQCNGTTQTTRHSTTMQQPTKQVDMARGKDATMRGEDNTTRGEQRRRRYFFGFTSFLRGGC